MNFPSLRPKLPLIFSDFKLLWPQTGGQPGGRKAYCSRVYVCVIMSYEAEHCAMKAQYRLLSLE